MGLKGRWSDPSAFCSVVGIVLPGEVTCYIICASVIAICRFS